MEQLSYKQLQQQITSLEQDNQALKNNLGMATERIEYWEDIATKQNTCILMQADRYDDIELKYKQALDKLNTPSKPLEAQITELKAKNTRFEERCTKLDNSLADYEDSYRNLRKKSSLKEKQIDNAKDTIDRLVFCLQKEEAMTSLLLQKLQKFNREVVNIRQHQSKKRASAPEISNDTIVITKTTKITLGKLGHYSISKD